MSSKAFFDVKATYQLPIGHSISSDLDYLQTFQVMQSHSNSRFQIVYWCQQYDYYASILAQYKCKYWEEPFPMPSSHKDRIRCLYKFNDEFMRLHDLQINPQSFLKFMAQNYKQFNFQYPQLLFRQQIIGKQYIEVMQRHDFCTTDSLYEAIGAAKIIKHIKDQKKGDIIQVIDQLWKDQMAHFSKISRLSAQRAKQVFMGMFSFQFAIHNQKKYYLNQIPFCQNRLSDGALTIQQRKMWIVYHPTSITQQIFRQTDITLVNSQKENSRSIYIHGQGGIGKSTAFSLLVGLHSFIQCYRLNQFPGILLSEYQQTQKQKLGQFPKYFYFNLPEGNALTQSVLFNTILEQLPLNQKIQVLKRKKKDISDLLRPYQKKKIQTILIVDQINVLFSNLRRKKYKDDYDSDKFCQSFYRVFGDITKKLRLIYGSSENAQLSLLGIIKGNITDRILTLNKSKIRHLSRYPQQQVVREIISIIQFQNINQMVKSQKISYQQILQIRKIYKQMKQNLSSQLYYKTISLYLQQFTHQSVKKYFQQKLQDRIFFLSENNHQLQDFVGLINRMYWFIIQLFSRNYSYFVLQKDQNELQRHKKFRLLTFIRMAAFKTLREEQNQELIQKLKEDFDQASYCFQYAMPPGFDQIQIELLFREHVEIQGKRLVILVSPRMFLYATAFMDQKDELVQHIVTNFVDDYKDQPDWFGKTVETTYINLIYGLPITLISGSSQMIVGKRGQSMPPYKFGHFMKMLTQKEKNDQKLIEDPQINISNSIMRRFSPLWDQIDESDVKLDLYICAKPCPQTEQGQFVNGVSSNSQAIDILFIKKVEEYDQKEQIRHQHYEIVTLDFCMGFQGSYVQAKRKKAQLFLKKFMAIARKEAHQYRPQLKRVGNRMMGKKRYIRSVKHFIVLPQIMIDRLTLSLQDFKKEGFSLGYIPVESLQVNIVMQGAEGDHRTQIRRRILAALKKTIYQKSENLRKSSP